jgi:hypothetical protein
MIEQLLRRMTIDAVNRLQNLQFASPVSDQSVSS